MKIGFTDDWIRIRWIDWIDWIAARDANKEFILMIGRLPHL